jgi:hypothetical protein
MPRVQLDSVQSEAKTAPPRPTEKRPAAVSRAATPRPDRAKKTNITGYFSQEVKSSMRLVQAKRGGSIQELLAEALNDLFRKYGVAATAPENER